MAGRTRDARTLRSAEQAATSPCAADPEISPSGDLATFCEVVNRLCPGLEQRDLLERMQMDEARRRRRVKRLQRRVSSGEYHVPAGVLGKSLLVEEGLTVP
jgi:hypothetical protein